MVYDPYTSKNIKIVEDAIHADPSVKIYGYRTYLFRHAVSHLNCEVFSHNERIISRLLRSRLSFIPDKKRYMYDSNEGLHALYDIMYGENSKARLEEDWAKFEQFLATDISYMQTYMRPGTY